MRRRIAVISYKEKRKWLLTWSSIYMVSSAALTTITYSKGPDSHEWYGCSVPLSLWSLFLFISTLSYYTTDYMHRGQQEGERERYVYDPKVMFPLSRKKAHCTQKAMAESFASACFAFCIIPFVGTSLLCASVNIQYTKTVSRLVINDLFA